MIDYSYTELEDRVLEVFENPNSRNRLTEITENTYFYAEYENEPDMFMCHLQAIVYEAKHNILTERLKAEFIDYSCRWDKGEFKSEVLPEDIPIIQADIDYVRAVLEKNR